MNKNFLFTIFLLISLLGFNNQVKADRISVQLPGGNISFCQNPLAMDTFVFYKPIGFGTSMWYVNFVPVGASDSLVLTPTSPGIYTINAIWNSIAEGVGLNLFTAPPGHATIGLSAGSTGHINTTRDTIWMCGSNPVTINVGTINGNEGTYQQWTGPSFFSNNGQITTSTPGTYIWERGNPCGITRDSVHLINLPTVLPTISGDTLCNQPVNHTLDAGPGWATYLWNTGATTPSIYTNVPGTFTVNVSNLCTTATKTVVIEQQNYLLPDCGMYSINHDGPLCHNEIGLLIPNPNFTYDTYTWRNIDEVIVGTSSTLTVDYNVGSSYYTVVVTKGSCSATSGAIIAFQPDPFATEVCVATYDPLIGKNKVVFSHDGIDAEDFVLCYKTGGQWAIIDSTPVASVPGNVYQMVDNVTDPQQQSRQYTVFARHACGHMSPLGDWHKTIRLAIFQDVISGDYILQIMDGFTTMSGFIPDSYTIWVDANNDGNLVSIGILEGGNTSFTVSNPIIGGAYYASVFLPWTCGNGYRPSPSTREFGINTYSNKRLFTPVGIEQLRLYEITISPNPSKGVFRFSREVSRAELYDHLGRYLFTQSGISEVDLSDYAAGLYIVKLYDTFATSPIIEKIIVE